MENILISIIVLNYNGKEYLERCFQSLLQLRYKNVELILVDNASTDESVTFMRKKFPDVKILENSDNNHSHIVKQVRITNN